MTYKILQALKQVLIRSYRYEPLNSDKREIRLFDLEPGKREDPIRGTLRTVSLDDDPQYECLSYLWGKLEKTFPVYIGEYYELRAHYNLCAALRDLRPEDETLTIWIDAICIDQTRLDEKSYQIPLMRDIYTRAKTVRAWLDVKVDANAEAFEQLSRLGDRISLEDYSVEYWLPVAEIFRNPYWYRVWIQQELILARKIILQCQRTILDGEMVLRFQKEICRHSHSPALHPMAHQLWKHFGSPHIYMDGLLDTRAHLCPHLKSTTLNQASAFKESPNALDLLIQSWALHCTVPHDRVYGLLGIMADIEIKQQSTLKGGMKSLLHKGQDLRFMIDTSTFVIDYEAPVREAYAQLVEKFIQTHHNLDFLPCLPIKDGPSNSPSWLPAPEKRPSMPYVDTDTCSASGRTNAQKAHIHYQGRILRTQGIRIDKICLVGDHTKLETVPISAWFSGLYQMLFQTCPPEQNQGVWSDTTLRSLLGLLFPPWGAEMYQWLIGKDSLTIDQQQATFTTLIQLFESGDISSLTLDDVFYGLKPEIKSLTSDARQGLIVLSRVLIHRMFVGTEAHRMGLVTQSDVQPGDEVWTLFGCPMPVILRPRGQDKQGYEMYGYTMITSGIISGLMDGEACEGILETGEPGPEYHGPPIQEINIW